MRENKRKLSLCLPASSRTWSVWVVEGVVWSVWVVEWVVWSVCGVEGIINAKTMKIAIACRNSRTLICLAS